MEGLGSKLGLEMGVRDQLGTKTWESLCPGNYFFSAQNGRSRFLGNEIMIFMYFYRNSIGFGRFGGIRFVTLWAQGGMGGPG